MTPGIHAFAGQEASCGTDLLFPVTGHPDLVLGIEICEDLWAPVPPSSLLARAGATVILNPSASNELDWQSGVSAFPCGQPVSPGALRVCLCVCQSNVNPPRIPCLADTCWWPKAVESFLRTPDSIQKGPCCWWMWTRSGCSTIGSMPGHFAKDCRGNPPCRFGGVWRCPGRSCRRRTQERRMRWPN